MRDGPYLRKDTYFHARHPYDGTRVGRAHIRLHNLGLRVDPKCQLSQIPPKLKGDPHVAATLSANSDTGRILVKLRASAPLGAAAARANLRPVFDRPAAGGGFGVNGAAQWFIADVPDLAVAPGTRANPWDFAHARVADQLGIAEDDLVFAEPDWVHGEAFRVDSEGQRTCTADPSGSEPRQSGRPSRFRLAFGR